MILNKLGKYKFPLIILVLALIGGGYYYYKNNQTSDTTVQYVTGEVTKGDLIVSVSTTGQVSALDQIDLKPKTSGDLVKVAVTSGQKVKKGDLIAQIDNRDALKTIRDAETSLVSAQLSLEKLKQPADELTILQSENSLTNAKEQKTQAEADLVKSYDDGFNTVANAFLDLPNVITGLQNILLSSTMNNNQWNKDYWIDSAKNYDEKIIQLGDQSYQSYLKARAAYDANFNDYKAASRSSSTDTIDSLINETYDTTKVMAGAVKDTTNFLQYYQDILTARNQKVNSQTSSYLTDLNNYTSKTNSHLLSLFSIRDSIQNNRSSITSADRTIAEKTASLAETKAGADPLDVKSQELSIQQKQNSLQDAREKLSDYYIKAPYDGIILDVASKYGDTVSASTTVATLATTQRVAEVTLNEVDISKVKVGQKATISFDAITDFSVTGEVVEVANIGTTSQGVVSYTVRVGFDVEDDRIKDGMSVSVAIITDSKLGILMVPTSAVKTKGSSSYIDVLDSGQLVSKTVTTGLSNDSYIEISASDIQEGDTIVTQTVSTKSSANTSSTSKSSSIIPGIGGGMMH